MWLAPRERLRQNARVVNRRPRLELVAPSASAEEAAAVVAALERFMRETAPVTVPATQEPDGWLRAALAEAVSRDTASHERDPWINT